jgi:hypothetical protein
MSDIIYVAASGIGLSDRNFTGRNSSPSTSTIYHYRTETTVLLRFMSPTTSPARLLCAKEAK